MTTILTELSAGRSLWVGLLPSKHTSFLPADAHITIAYLGKGVPQEHVADLQSTLAAETRHWGRQTLGFHAVARFRMAPGQREPVVLLVRRNRVLNQMRDAFYGTDDRPGEEWNPHVTLSWAEPGDQVCLDSVAFLSDASFDRLILACGDAREEYPLVAGFKRELLK